MTHRRLNWRNIIHGACLMAIIAIVMILMSIDWGSLV